MANSQTDPARLRDAALAQWYSRSPTQIIEQKLQAARRAYDDFFSQPEGREVASVPAGEVPRPAVQSSAGVDDADLVWRQIGPNCFRGERNPQPAPNSSAGGGSLQIAAATFPVWGSWPINGCSNCHNPQTGELRPRRGEAPYPPLLRQGRGGSRGGASSSDGEWSDEPGCNEQFIEDRKICQRAQSAQCWENQMKRLGHCNQTGKTGYPPLGFGR